MQITDQRGLEWKLARLGENIIKPGLYMYVQDVRQTCWTQVMELTCTWTLPPTATIISLPAFSQDYSMYSTLESNLLSPYSSFLPFLFLPTCVYKGSSRASQCAVYTDTNLLSKQWQIPLLHVDTELMFGLFACRPVFSFSFFFTPFPRCHRAQQTLENRLMSRRKVKQSQKKKQQMKKLRVSRNHPESSQKAPRSS